MKNKITIAIVALMVAALAAPLVMAADPTYIATVKTGQDTSTAVNVVGFGDIFRGTDKTITGSLTLTNVGDWDAGVKAKCSTPTADPTTPGIGDYGLIGSTDDADATKDTDDEVLIGGDNLELGATLVALTDDGEDAEIDDGTGVNKVPKKVGTVDGSVTYDARLDVPSGQTADSYSGLVTITFFNAP